MWSRMSSTPRAESRFLDGDGNGDMDGWCQFPGRGPRDRHRVTGKLAASRFVVIFYLVLRLRVCVCACGACHKKTFCTLGYAAVFRSEMSLDGSSTATEHARGTAMLSDIRWVQRSGRRTRNRVVSSSTDRLALLAVM